MTKPSRIRATVGRGAWLTKGKVYDAKWSKDGNVFIVDDLGSETGLFDDEWEPADAAPPAATPQPPPVGNGTPITPLVIADFEARSREGAKKYGTVLRADNGRDALMDAYQEALDLVQYLRQAIEERAAKEAR